MRSPHSLQSSDNLENLRREAKQRRDDFKALCECSILESYLNGTLSLILDLAPRRDLLAVGANSGKADEQAIDLSAFVLQFQAVNSNDIEHRDQQMVFVVNVQSMDGPDVVVPSVVRFHSLNYEIKERRSGVYFSILRERIFKPLFGFHNGELAVTPLESGGTNPAERVAPCEIESAFQIVDCVTRHKRDIGSDIPIGVAVVEELFPRLRVSMDAGSVFIQRAADSLLDIRDVLVGPFDF